jgi:alkylhydroperoxidase family enzyme
MEPMYLKEVEARGSGAGATDTIRYMQAQGMLVPQIQYLFAFKPERTRHLEQFTQAVMRGPSPLSPGQRELIAAFTSRKNNCAF